MTGLAHAPFFLAPDADDSFRMFGVSQEVPYPGKRSLKTNIAATEVDAERWNFESTRRRLVSDLKSAYFEYVFITRSLAVLARNKDRLEQFRQIAEARFSVGKAIQQDVIKWQLEVSLLIERQATLEQQQTALRAAINWLLYRRPDVPLDVALDYERAPLSRTVEELRDLVQQNNPMLKRDERAIDRPAGAKPVLKRARHAIVNGLNIEQTASGLSASWHRAVCSYAHDMGSQMETPAPCSRRRLAVQNGCGIVGTRWGHFRKRCSGAGLKC